MSHLARRRWAAGATYLALGLVALQTLYPLLWVVFGSLKDKPALVANVWGPPTRLLWENYVQAWDISGMGSHVVNSAVVTATALLLVVAVATPCAYVVTRIRFPGRAILLGVAIAALLIPPQVMAIPLFLVARDLHLLNNRFGVALVYAASGLPLSIFILRSFFMTLPKELEDAARVDGAGLFTVFTRIMLPLARPGIALVLLFQFVEIWNEFFLASMMLREPSVQTIPLGLVGFFQQYDSQWPLYFASLVTTILPVIVVFVFVQKQFIGGLTAGAVRG